MKTGEIIEYVRDKKGNPRGVILAIGTDERDADGSQEYRFGWSLCRKGDLFTKKRALAIARARAKETSSRADSPVIVVPLAVFAKCPEFSARCKRYFKGKE